MKTAAPRYPYLDILKILAMIMVCSYHFVNVPSIQYTSGMTFFSGFPRALFGINSVCVPIFFMVNGALLLCTSADNIHYGKHFLKVFKLFIGYYIWRLVTVLIIRFFHKKPLFPSGILSFLMGESEGVTLNHFWFISTLIAIYLIYPLVYTQFQIFTKNAFASYIPWFVIVLFVLYFVPGIGTFFLRLFHIDKQISSLLSPFVPFTEMKGAMLLYFIIGGILHSKIELLRKIHFAIPFGGFILGFLFLYYHWWKMVVWKQGGWDNVYGAYITFPCLLMSVSLFALASIIQFSSPDSFCVKTLTFFGSNTLGVYYLHWIYGYTLYEILPRFLPTNTLFANFVRGCMWVIVFSFISGIAKKLQLYAAKYISKKYLKRE